MPSGTAAPSGPAAPTLRRLPRAAAVRRSIAMCVSWSACVPGDPGCLGQRRCRLGQPRLPCLPCPALPDPLSRSRARAHCGLRYRPSRLAPVASVSGGGGGCRLRLACNSMTGMRYATSAAAQITMSADMGRTCHCLRAAAHPHSMGTWACDALRLAPAARTADEGAGAAELLVPWREQVGAQDCAPLPAPDAAVRTVVVAHRVVQPVAGHQAGQGHLSSLGHLRLAGQQQAWSRQCRHGAGWPEELL
jgi:hypothetical protein